MGLVLSLNHRINGTPMRGGQALVPAEGGPVASGLEERTSARIAPCSVFELSVCHHVLNLVPPVELIAAGQLRDKVDLFAFRRDERLSIDHSRKNEAGPDSVLVRWLEFLKENSLSALGLEEGVVFEVGGAPGVQQRHCLLRICASLLRIASDGDDDVFEKLTGNKLLQLSGGLFVHSALLPELDQSTISLPYWPGGKKAHVKTEMEGLGRVGFGSGCSALPPAGRGPEHLAGG